MESREMLLGNKEVIIPLSFYSVCYKDGAMCVTLDLTVLPLELSTSLCL